MSAHMSQSADPSGFGAFVPGFDFLQKLAQGGPTTFQQWVAPTMDPKALDQRIAELKAVQFWLEQNAAALKATLQALEVQKMTLAALHSMNAMPDAKPKAADPSSAPNQTNAQANPPSGAQPDPMQYWAALTQQFQKIAADAMSDVARRAATAPPSAAAAKKPSAAAPAKKPRRSKGDGAA